MRKNFGKKTPTHLASSSVTSQQNEYTFYFEVCPSHLTLSHNFSSAIKPKTYYQLHLIKDSHDSSQINKYQNFPISARVYQGKIIISNVRLSFSVECDKNFTPLNNIYLKLVQLKSHQFADDIQIGEYQLDINELINNFRIKQQKYHYQECVIHPEAYLTYEVFVERNRASLQFFILEQRYKQRRQMREHIMKSLEEKKNIIRKTELSNQEQKQLKQVLKAHLIVLHHLDSDGKGIQDKQAKYDFEKNKLFIKQEQLPNDSNDYSLKNNTAKQNLQTLSEERGIFSIKSSHIDFKEEIYAPTFKDSADRIRKSQSQEGSVFPIQESGLLKNDSSGPRNQSDMILIDVLVPRIFENRIVPDSIISFRNQKSSQLSLNNEYEQVVERMMQFQKKKRENGNFRTSYLMDQLDYADTNSIINKHQHEPKQQKLNAKSNQISMISQISLTSGIWDAQMRKTKFLILLISVIALGLFMYIVDHPYFDIFQGKFQDVIDERPKKSKKNHKKEKDQAAKKFKTHNNKK